MNKKIFFAAILFVSNNMYAAPTQLTADELNSKALMAEAEYNLLPLPHVFVDGKYNKNYVDAIYDNYSPIFQKNRMDYFLDLKKNGLLENDISKSKAYLENNMCDKNDSACIYVMRRITDMYKLSLMVNDGRSESYINNTLFSEEANLENKNLLMKRYIEKYNSVNSQ